MRFSLATLIAGAALALAGCSAEPDRTSVYWLPSNLPASVNPVAQFACETAPVGTDPDSAAILGLRGLERLESDAYTELPFLRVGTFRIGMADAPTTLDEIAAESADPGSARPTSVNDSRAVSFTITTAEPIPTAWPAIGWIDDGIGITMLGEGFDEATVLEIAEAFEPVPRAEFLAAGFDPTICDLVNE